MIGNDEDEMMLMAMVMEMSMTTTMAMTMTMTMTMMRTLNPIELLKVQQNSSGVQNFHLHGSPLLSVHPKLSPHLSNPAYQKIYKILLFFKLNQI